MSNFIEAAKAGSVPRVKEMLSYGTDVNCVHPKDGSSALYWAACQGHYKLCDLLIRQGANLNLPVRWGSLPIHGAADRGHSDCLTLLIARSDLGTQNDNLDTPLHLAACRGHLDICRQLLQYGAPLHLVNSQQKTPMDEARTNHHDRVYQLLAQATLAPLCKDIRGIPGTTGGCFRHTSPVLYSPVPPLPVKHITVPLPGRFPACLEGNESVVNKNPAEDDKNLIAAEEVEREKRSKPPQSLHDCFEEVGEGIQSIPPADHSVGDSHCQVRGRSTPASNQTEPAENDPVASNGLEFKTSTRSESSSQPSSLATNAHSFSVADHGSLPPRSSWNGQPDKSQEMHTDGVNTTIASTCRAPSDGIHTHLRQLRSSSPDPAKYQQMKDLVKGLTTRVERLETERENLRIQLSSKDDTVQALYRSIGVLNKQLEHEKEKNSQLQADRRDLQQQLTIGHTKVQGVSQHLTQLPLYTSSERELLGCTSSVSDVSPVDLRSGEVTHRRICNDGSEWAQTGSRAERNRLLSREVDTTVQSSEPTPVTTTTSSPPRMLLYSMLLKLLRPSLDSILQTLCSTILNTLQTCLVPQPQTRGLDGKRGPWKLDVDYQVDGEPKFLGGTCRSWTLPVRDTQRERRYNLEVSDNFDANSGWHVLKSLPTHPNVIKVLHHYCDSPILSLQPHADRDAPEQSLLFCVTENYPCNLSSITDDIRQCRKADSRMSFLMQTFYQLLCAVEHLSKVGIVHGNITDRSAYLDRNLRVVLGNWHTAERRKQSGEQPPLLENYITANDDLISASLLVQDLLNCERAMAATASRNGDLAESSPGTTSLAVHGKFRALVEECVHGYLDVAQTRLRVGMLLFGPAPGFEEISSEKDATIWMLTSSLSSLSQLANTTTSLDGSTDDDAVLTLAQAVEVNHGVLERHFLCSISPQELWQFLRSTS